MGLPVFVAVPTPRTSMPQKIINDVTKSTRYGRGSREEVVESPPAMQADEGVGSGSFVLTLGLNMR